MTSIPASKNRPSHGMSRKGLFQDDLILTSPFSSERRKATLHITVERAFQPATTAFGPACLSAPENMSARTPTLVAVGMPVTRHPPHRPVLAQLTHTVPTLDMFGVKARRRVRVLDADLGEQDC